MESEIESRSLTNKMWLLENAGYTREAAISYIESSGSDHSHKSGVLLSDLYEHQHTSED